MVASQRTNGPTLSLADMLNGAEPADLSPGVYGYWAVLNRDTQIPLREARRNTANNATPEGVTRDRYTTTVGKMYSSIVEELTRYHGHILNNQAESAMIADKKAFDAIPENKGKTFNRTQALHDWRIKKIAEIESDMGLGIRAASAPVLPKKDRMERDEAFKILAAAAAKSGSTFPDKITPATLKQVVSKGRTLETMLAALLATPVTGGQIREKVQKLLEEEAKSLDAASAELDNLFGGEDDEESEGDDEDEGTEEAPTPPPAA